MFFIKRAKAVTRKIRLVVLSLTFFDFWHLNNQCWKNKNEFYVYRMALRFRLIPSRIHASGVLFLFFLFFAPEKSVSED
jgi:hypothetical protein